MTTTATSLRKELQAGNPEAWRELVRDLSPGMYRYASSMLGDPADAQDAVQQAFIRLHSARAGLNADGNLRTLAFRVVTNLARDMRRDSRLRREREALAAEHNMRSADPATAALAKEALAAAQDLPVDLREVVMLRFAQGFTAAETAEALGLPEGTVKTRQRTALEKLRERLAGAMAALPVPVEAENALEQGAAQQAIPDSVLQAMETVIMASIATKTGSYVLIWVLMLVLLLGGAGVVAWRFLEPPSAANEHALQLARHDNARDNKRGKAGTLPGNESKEPGRGGAANVAGASTTDNTHRPIEQPSGQDLVIKGQVLDQDGNPVPGAAVLVGRASAPAPAVPRFYRIGQGSVAMAGIRVETPFAQSDVVTSDTPVHFASAPAIATADNKGMFVLKGVADAIPERAVVSLTARMDGFEDGHAEYFPGRAGHTPKLVLRSLGRCALFETDPAVNEPIGVMCTTTFTGVAYSSATYTTLDSKGRHRVDLNSYEALGVELRLRPAKHLPLVVQVPGSERQCQDLGTLKLTTGRRIAGRVTDSKGLPVAGALVCLSEAMPVVLACDASGAFEFAVNHGDGAVVVARAENLAEGRVVVNDGTENATGLQIQLGAGTEVSGTVHDAAGAALCDGVQVILMDAREARAYPGTRRSDLPYGSCGVRPDQTGTFAFRRVPPGEYVVYASIGKSSAGMRYIAQPISVENLPVTVRLVMGRTSITGKVLGSDGQPLPSARVFLGNSDLKRVDEGTTDENGVYRFDSLEPGAFVVLLEEHDSPTPALFSRRRVVVQEGECAVLDISLADREPGNVLKASFPGARFEALFLAGAGASQAALRCNANADGVFELGGIPPGSYYAWFIPKGNGLPLRRCVDFQGWDETRELNEAIVMDQLAVSVEGTDLKLGQVRLHITPELEHPFGDDSLELMLESKPFAGKDGTQTITGLPRGRYCVTAFAPGRATVSATVDTASSADVRLQLEPMGSTLRARLVGIADTALEGVQPQSPKRALTARLFPDGQKMPLRVLLSALAKDTELRFEDIPAGRYRLEIAGALLVPVSVEVDVADSRESKAMEVSIQLAACLMVSASALSGAELQSCGLRIRDDAGREYFPRGRLSAALFGAPDESDNVREVGPLPPGTWRLEFLVHGHEPVTAELVVKAGERVPLTLDIK